MRFFTNQRRHDEERLLGVDLGQGYLLGRPNPEPLPPRRLDVLGSAIARTAGGAKRAAGRATPDQRRRAVVPTD